MTVIQFRTIFYKSKGLGKNQLILSEKSGGYYLNSHF